MLKKLLRDDTLSFSSASLEKFSSLGKPASRRQARAKTPANATHRRTQGEGLMAAGRTLKCRRGDSPEERTAELTWATACCQRSRATSRRALCRRRCRRRPPPTTTSARGNRACARRVPRRLLAPTWRWRWRRRPSTWRRLGGGRDVSCELCFSD